MGRVSQSLGTESVHRSFWQKALTGLLIGGILFGPLPLSARAQSPAETNSAPPPAASLAPPAAVATQTPGMPTDPNALSNPASQLAAPAAVSFVQAGGVDPSQPPPQQPPTSGAGLGFVTLDQARKMIDDALKERDDKQKADAEKKKAEEAAKKAEEPAWYQVGSKLDMSAHWRNGVWFETPNKDFTFHVGGAVQYDLSFYAPDNNIDSGPHNAGPFNDGANLRRGRLRAEGTMWEVIDYRFELEFFNGVLPRAAPQNSTLASQLQSFATPGPTDAWFTITHLPIIGNVRVGNQKEPISLEHLESFRFLPFLERSPLFDYLTPTAFNNGFVPGIMLFNTAFSERMTWAIGGFKNSYDVYGFGLGDGEYAATGRLTALPWYEQNGAYMIHVGVAGSHRDPIQDQVRFRVRTSDRNAPAPLTPFVNVLIDTGFFNTTSENIMGLEFFMNLGSFTMQSEYQATWCSNSSTAASGPLGTTFFSGYYVQALYWLTGEHTNWDKKAAAPDRYSINSPFYLIPGRCGWINGTGAWQVGVRWSHVDLNSAAINGGILGDLTVGLNWILNPNTKFQFNYDWEHRGGYTAPSNGDLHALGLRMQFDF